MMGGAMHQPERPGTSGRLRIADTARMLPNSTQQLTSRDQPNRETKAPRTRLAAERQGRWAGIPHGLG